MEFFHCSKVQHTARASLLPPMIFFTFFAKRLSTGSRPDCSAQRNLRESLNRGQNRAVCEALSACGRGVCVLFQEEKGESSSGGEERETNY